MSSPIAPRTFKAALVQVKLPGAVPLRGVVMQYNPEKVSRTVSVTSADGGGAKGGEPLRLRGPASETIRMEAVIDAADQLERPQEHTATVREGISPQLAALELFLSPTTSQIAKVASLASQGVLEVLPMEAPMTVLVWGRGRVLPVRLNELTIEEQFFDAGLNPIRATVTLSMSVMTVNELGLDHPGGAMHLAALARKEALAPKASTSISDLGSFAALL